MASTGIIFNSVTSFVLQPQLTKRKVKRDQLDTLSEIYIGPSGGEWSFVPAIGSIHPYYNLLSLISTDVTELPALIVQVTLHYQGKIDNSGTGRYTSVPTISRY